jgi:hypothetical protein
LSWLVIARVYLIGNCNSTKNETQHVAFLPYPRTADRNTSYNYKYK